MKSNKLKTIQSLSVCLVIVSCSDKQENPQVSQRPPVPFPVTQLQPKTVTGFTEYPAASEGIINSDVRAKTSGYIQKVLVDEGQKITKMRSVI